MVSDDLASAKHALVEYGVHFEQLCAKGNSRQTGVNGGAVIGKANRQIGEALLQIGQHIQANVFDQRMFGPDAKSSLTIDQLAELVKGARYLAIANQHPVDKNDTSAYTELKGIFEKSLAVNKDLPAGHVLTKADLESKKPSGAGIPAKEFERVLGKTLASAKAQYDFLHETDLLQP